MAGYHLPHPPSVRTLRKPAHQAPQTPGAIMGSDPILYLLGVDEFGQMLHAFDVVLVVFDEVLPADTQVLAEASV